MQRGFKLFLDMDVRNEIVKYDGKFLALVGEKSQLATIDNKTQSHRINHEYKIISNAGMCPLNDNFFVIYEIVNEWINRL
ncbi:hypothetical protein [Bartonella sp. B41]